MMLAGVIYLYLQTPTRSFDFETIRQTGMALGECPQHILFCAFFIAFAIKMPIFPFIPGSPIRMSSRPPRLRIVLSALMVKMGLFATVKWLVPVLPEVLLTGPIR